MLLCWAIARQLYRWQPETMYRRYITEVTAVRLKVEQIQLAADIVFFECGPGFGKRLGHRHFLEKGDREDLEQSVEGGLQGEALLDDGDQDIDGNRAPDLRLHRVVRGAVELFDSKMLLDPFEEQFDLPAALVEGADRRGRQGELVGEKHQRLSCFGVLEADAAQMNRIVLAGGLAIQRDGLVCNDAGRAIGWRRVDAVGIQVRLGAGDEEGASLIQDVKAREIDKD